jgi:archaemetzincin
MNIKLFFQLLLMVAATSIAVAGLIVTKNKNRFLNATSEAIEHSSEKTTKTIILLPLGKNLPEHFINHNYRTIQKILPGIQLRPAVKFPQMAFYPPRNRYRADSLIRWMGRQAKANEVYLGITQTDISTTTRGHKDWGVMGLGFCPGNAAVASNHRLKNKSHFWKVALHELGHTTGLQHCPVKTCLMRDAQGGDPTGEEKEFCPKCKKALIQNGWKL